MSDPSTPDNSPEPSSLTPAEPTDAIEERPDDQGATQVVHEEYYHARSYQGPLPSPEVLAEFDEVVPGLAERIVVAWETQTAHRQSLEVGAVGRSDRRKDRAQIFSFATSIAGVIAAGLVGVHGHWSAAIGIAAVAVGGPGAALYLARSLPARRGENEQEH